MKIGKQEYAMLHNGAAMFAIRDKFGENFGLFDVLKEDSTESFETACEVAAILVEQGELLRRFQGHTPRPILGADAIKMLIMPTYIPSFKREIAEAIVSGYKREVLEDEIDLGLAELHKKKELS